MWPAGILRACAAVALALLVATCRDAVGPQGTGAGQGRVVFAPILPSEAALASFGLAIDQVRIIVVRPAADTLADTTVALPPDSSSLDLDLHVALLSDPETLSVSIVALSGSQPLFTGTSDVEVTSGSGTPAPADIPVDNYVGPGALVDSIAIQPAAPFIYLNDSLRFQVQAFQAGVPVTQFYIAWSTSDSTIATVNGFGVLRAPATRTSVRVVARTPGAGAVDSTTAAFVPFPTQLLVIAGGGQTGAVGQPLATQLEVEVSALDNLPVGGVEVRFRSLSGGSPADTVVTADVLGRVRVTGVLGATPGPQAFQASLPDFPSVTAASFSANATSVAISPATSIVTVTSGSVVSGNTVTLRLQGKDGAGNDITTGGANVVFTRTGGSSTGSIGATADGSNGVYTAVFTGVLSGTATTIGATINGSPVTTALPTISVSPGVLSAAGSVVTVSNGTVASGAAVTLRLQGKDAAGNNVAAGGATVVFSASGGTSTGNVSTTADSGTGVYTATFTGVLAGTATSIGATADGSPVTTGQPALVVLPGAPAQLAFVATPSVAQTGVVISPAPQVAGRDVAGNATPAYAGDVTIAIGTNPGSGALAGTLVRTASGGAATFDDLAIDQPGIGYTLRATALGMGSDTTASFDVVPPAGTIVWANAAGGNWSNPANWSGGVVPSAIETAAITLPGTYTVTLDVGDTIGGLQLGASSGTQTLLAASRTLHVSGTTQVNANGVLDWRASTLAGGTLTNAGTVQVNGSSTVDVGVVTSPTSRIRVQGNGIYGATVLTVSNSFTNNGAIELTDTTSSFGATLSMPAGTTLVNGPGGTVEAAVGAAGPRTLTLTLDNQGTVTLNRALTLNRTGAAQTNSGTINVTAGDLTISQTGLGSSFTTSGVISIAEGRALLLTGGSFDYAAGTIVGGGTLSLTTTNVTITPLLSTGSVGLSLANAAVSGAGTLTVAASTALEIKASTISVPFVNQGLVTVHGSSTLSGAVTNAAGAALRAQGNGIYGAAFLTVANSFTNDGAIVLTDTASSFGATLTMPAGATLTNAAGGTIDAAAGFAGARTLTLALDNQGTVTLNRPLTINRGGAVHTNSGSVDVSGGDLTLTQSGGGASFTMAGAGTVTIGPTQTFAVSGGAFNYTSGTISGGTFSVSSVAVTSTQPFNTATAALILISSTWGGSGAITVNGATALDVRASTISAPLVNQASIRVNGSSAFNGGFSNPPGATLTIQGNGIYGAAFLTVGTSFTNAGGIVLTDTSSAFGATLSMPAGATLTNASGATIEAAVGAAGGRTLALALDNQGIVTLNRPLTLSRADATHLNSGTIDVSGGDFTLNQTGVSPRFATSGSIPIAAGRTFSVSGGAFDYTAGTISGAGTFSIASVTVTAAQSFSTATTALSLSSSTWGGGGTLTVATGTTLLLRASTVSAPFVNQGLLVAAGSSALNGSVANVPAATLRVQGNGTYGQGILTIASGFTNDGAIELTDTSSAFGATLAVTAGTLVNASGGTIAALLGANGPRSLNAHLDNQGTIAVATAASQAMTINKAGADHQNSGAIDVSGGDLTFTQSGTTPSFTNNGTVTIAGGDTLRISGGAFTHGGGSLGGAGSMVLSNVNASFDATQAVAAMAVSNSTVSFATPQNTSATGFEFLSTTINGPGTFTNDLGKTLILRSSIVNTPLDNQGTLLATGATTINDTLTTGTSSLFRLEGNGTFGSVSVTVAKGFENAGTVELTDVAGGFGSTLVVPNGKLVNLAGGVVSAAAGANGLRSLTAALDNQGLLAVTLLPGRDLVMNRTNSVHTNSGTIDIAGGDIAISNATSFQNLGAINIGGSDTLSITGGAFSFDAGTLGTGTLVLSFVSPANFNKPHTLGSIVMNNTTANFAADQSTASTDFALSSSSVFNGPGTLTNAPGRTLKVQASAISAPLINEGMLAVSGTSSLDALTTMPASTLRLQGNGQVGAASLTVPNGLVNNGTIELTDSAGAFGATLVVKTLPLVNAATGTIDIQPGANGPRTIDVVGLDNQGTITGNHSVTISHPDAVHTNRGTITVKAGAMTFAQSGTNASFTNQAGGIIDIDAGTAFRVASATTTNVINALGGKILGFGTLLVRPPVVFSNDGEIIPGASPGQLTIDGNMQIPTTGIITIELGGPTPGTEYDQLAITGNAIFAEGTLNVVLLPTLPDPKGLSFDVMTFGSGSGMFRNFTVPPGCNQPVNMGTSIRVICP